MTGSPVLARQQNRTYSTTTVGIRRQFLLFEQERPGTKKKPFFPPTLAIVQLKINHLQLKLLYTIIH